MRFRLDAELVRRKLARSREHAQDLITRGLVKVGGLPATKAATQVNQSDSILVENMEDEYVSRGGYKLAGALDHFKDLVVQERRCLDAGASTGGFTDVLLRRGAKEVIAVDVGYGQLAWQLQSDRRVKVLDRTNIRELKLEDIGIPVQLIVGDLSFISLKTVLPNLVKLLEGEGEMLLMVKPQFEVGRERLGDGGVVRDPILRAQSVAEVAAKALEFGLGCAGVVASSLPGPSGNVEYFLWLKRGASALDPELLKSAIEKGPQ